MKQKIFEVLSKMEGTGTRPAERNVELFCCERFPGRLRPRLIANAQQKSEEETC